MSIRVGGGAPDAVVTASQLDVFREAVKERLDSADKAGATAAQEITALRSRVATLETELAKATSTASTSLRSVQKEVVAAVAALEDNWEAHNTCLAGFLKKGAVADGLQGCPKPSDDATRCSDIKVRGPEPCLPSHAACVRSRAHAPLHGGACVRVVEATAPRSLSACAPLTQGGLVGGRRRRRG